jgi:hypothetical protein
VLEFLGLDGTDPSFDDYLNDLTSFGVDRLAKEPEIQAAELRRINKARDEVNNELFKKIY